MILPKEKFLLKLPVHVHIRAIHATREIWVNGWHLKPDDLQLIKSPHGFNWGYGGVAPAALAFDLLLMWVDRDTAFHYHSDLKFGYIAGLPQRDFSVHTNLKWVMQTILEVGPFEAVKQVVHI